MAGPRRTVCTVKALSGSGVLRHSARLLGNGEPLFRTGKSVQEPGGGCTSTSRRCCGGLRGPPTTPRPGTEEEQTAAAHLGSWVDPSPAAVAWRGARGAGGSWGLGFRLCQQMGSCLQPESVCSPVGLPTPPSEMERRDGRAWRGWPTPHHPLVHGAARRRDDGGSGALAQG